MHPHGSNQTCDCEHGSLDPPGQRRHFPPRGVGPAPGCRRVESPDSPSLPAAISSGRGRLAINSAPRAWITQFAAPRHRRPSPSRRFLRRLDRGSATKGEAKTDGVQLRRRHRRGGQVPRPPQQQHHHHADGRRGVVPAHDAPELLVLRVLRQRRRSAQVRVRPHDPRGVLQVPPPPHRLPGPRPPAPVPAGLPGRRRVRRAAPGRLLPHRRGAVSGAASRDGTVRP